LGQRMAPLEFNHLQRKIFFTLGFLALYRVGIHVPVSGVDTQALTEFFSSQSGNMFGMINMFVGGALERFSVFALGVMPYISASIIAQLLTVVVPALEQLQKEGDAGRKKITQYTRYATVVLAIIQGSMIANTLESASFGNQSLVIDGGIGWKMLTVLSLTAGTCFVMWLGEQITDKGVGNGISLIIFAGIVANLPTAISRTYEQYSSQELDNFRIILLVGLVVGITAAVVFMEQGARLIPVQYAKRQVGRKQYGGQSSNLPLRLNSAGVIPPIFASSLLQFPWTIASFNQGTGFADFINTYFVPGNWLYNTVYVALILFFGFFYTSITFKPEDIAENLKKHGGYVPGIRPGARTAEYLSKISMRLTLFGAAYLAALCVIPTVMMSRFGVQFYFGGTSLLIVVGVALDTFRQIEAHRQSLRYDSFLKKTSIRSRGRRV
jgi:preprotein translocase subunit SecY